MDGQPQQQAFPMMPMFVQPQWQQHVPPPQDEVAPARVRVALEFFTRCTHKTMTRAAAAPQALAVEIIPGQQLTAPEEQALGAACDLLYDYFRGTEKASESERIDLQRRRYDAHELAGNIIQCPVCSQTRPNKKCLVCRGTGGVVAYPLEPNQ
jgi:hypothetical protein